MKLSQLVIISLTCTGLSLSCKHDIPVSTGKVRPLRDTIGFAQFPWQMDSIMKRIERSGWNRADTTSVRFAICPHDDYTYVGKLYPELCQNIKAPNLILIGVAHSAAKMHIEDSLVFDSFDEWKGPWKDVKILPERKDIYMKLAGRYAIINDSLHIAEHSIEAMIPFLQYFDRDVSIIPILVPAMSPGRMKECGIALAEAISEIAARNKWQWGIDYAIVVTTDAVHYGNEAWGGKDMAFYGCDNAGNAKALEHENEIISNCFTGELSPEKIQLFSSYTLDSSDYHNYRWTWCGRYSVPLAMFTAFYLDKEHTLSVISSGYSTSITSGHIPVDDIRMGRTAIATGCHWVGYAAVVYK